MSSEHRGRPTITILVAPAVAAYAADVQPGTLRQWVARGHIPAPTNGLYDLDAILAWSDRRSHRHALAARHQRHAHRRVSCVSAENV